MLADFGGKNKLATVEQAKGRLGSVELADFGKVGLVALIWLILERVGLVQLS